MDRNDMKLQFFSKHKRGFSWSDRQATLETKCTHRHKSFRMNINSLPLKQPPINSLMDQCPRLHRITKRSTQKTNNFHDTLSTFKYNKWFIKPQKRMKIIPSNQKNQPKRVKTQSIYFQINLDCSIYDNLYQDFIIDKENPMNVKKNITIENISKISQDSIDYLKTFKETLQGKNKRVPKIIDLFIEKKRQKYLTDRPK